MVAEQFTLGTRAHTFGNDFMRTVLRKGRSERTGQTILRTSEVPYMGANYRVSVGSSGSITTASLTDGTGAPTHTPTVSDQIYRDNSTGQTYWWNGAWNPL